MKRSASTNHSVNQNTESSKSASTITSDPNGVALMLDARNILCRLRLLNKVRGNIFAAEWENFVSSCGFKYLAKREKSTRARNLFLKVFNGSYKKEIEFDDALFRALNHSLDGDQNLDIVDEEGKGYVLKGRHVGFFRKVQRNVLGFDVRYGAAKESVPDHSCVVYRQDEKAVPLNYVVQDVTAAVELKLGESNCRELVVVDGLPDAPKISKDHSPIGQALTYSLDVLHCLARRAIHASEVPVVVLGGKKTDCQHDKLLCGVEAKLQVPQRCDEDFFYYINDIVPFTDDNFSEIAAAIYLRTMTVGIKYACAIEKLYKESQSGGNRVYPVSLCCRQLSLSGIVVSNAKFVASPIPGATKIESDLTVHQGELFSLAEIGDLQLDENRNDQFILSMLNKTGPLLIKVHCLSVHNYLVHPLRTKDAIRAICLSRNGALIKELSKVLLAYIAESGSTFISVMTDLTKIDGPKFTILEPIQLNGEIGSLWAAFQDLVLKVLLPLANIGIVHADLRAGWRKTHNVMVRRTESAGLELVLVDYESLIQYKESLPHDARVISKDYLELSGKKSTAHEYLWWQILLFAYVWQSQENNDNPESRFSFTFVTSLFTSPTYQSFRYFLREQLGNLQQMSQSNSNAKTVESLLEILSTSFCNM